MSKAKWITSYIDVLFILIALLTLYLSFMDIKLPTIIGIFLNDTSSLYSSKLHHIGTPEIRPDAVTTSIFQKIEEKKKSKIIVIEPNKEYELPLPLITFELGKYTLTPKTKKILDQASNLLKRLPFCADVIVEGYADSTPVRKDPFGNWELSLNRAISVAKYLESKNIPQKNITVIGFSNKKYMAKELTNELKILNRNAKIKIKVSKSCLKQKK